MSSILLSVMNNCLFINLSLHRQFIIMLSEFAWIFKFTTGDNTSQQAGDNTSQQTGDNTSQQTGDNTSQQTGDNTSQQTDANISQQTGDNRSQQTGDVMSFLPFYSNDQVEWSTKNKGLINVTRLFNKTLS